MLFELAAYFIVGALNFVIGSYVLSKNPRGIVHRSFFVFILGIVSWSMSIILLAWTGAAWLITLPFWGAGLMVLGFILLAEFFPDGACVRRRFVYSFVPWLAAVLLIPFNLVIRTVFLDKTGYLKPEHGPLFPLFEVIMGAYLIWGIVILFRKYRVLRGIRRVQMRYFAAGAGVFLFFAFLTNALLPMFRIFQFNLVGPLFSIIFVGATAYAIVRHQFMDIRVVIQRGLLYACSLALITGIFFGLDFVIRMFTNTEGWGDDVIAAIVGGFSFIWFRRFFERVTDPIFFRGEYRYADAVHELGPLLHSTIDLPALLVTLDGFLMRTIKPERVIFVIPDAEVTFFFHGTERFLSPKEEADEKASIITLSRNISAPIFFQEHEKTVGDHGAIVAIIPLVAQKGPAATMFLGKKLSDDIFRSNDIALLSVVGHHAGMAIENARLYVASRRYGAELEEKVRVRTEEIRGMQAAQSKFMTDVSHELQTPVAVLRANMEILEGRRKGSRKIALSIASVTLARMAQMVDHLLAVARLNFSKDKLHKREIVVDDLLGDAYNDCLILAEDKGVLLSYASDPIRITGDKDKLKEVILNLMSNALKYTARGGKIVLLAKKAGDRAEISVRDTGTGIPPDKLPHIFERFYRINAGDCPGSGLGLDICKQIVEMHGGTVRAESAVGKGSIFIVSLPLAAPAGSGGSAISKNP